MNPRTVLGDRRIRYLASAQALSVLGDGCNGVAMAFAVFSLTGSAGALSAVLTARVLGLTVSLLFGGVLADRADRLRILVGSDLVRFVSQGLTAAALFGGHAGVAGLAALQLVHGLASGCFLPTYGGFVPQLVPPAALQQANASISAVSGVANVAGPALAGVLTATLGPAWALGLDSLTFLAGALLLVAGGRGTRSAAADAGGERASVLADLRAGAAEVRARPWLTAGIGYFVVNQLCVAGPLFVLGPIAAERVLGGATAWGTLLTAFSIGSVLGSLAAARLVPRRPMPAFLASSVLTVPLLLAMGAGAGLGVLVVAEVLAGAAVMFTDIVWQSTMQKHVPDETLSRVLSWDLFGYTVSRPVSMGLVGLLAQHAGTRTTFAAAAALLAASAVLTLLVPGVRSLTDRAAPAPLPPDPDRSPA
ncbi:MULTISPECIES: MFS transporter [Kitasatospora]|uniref:Putative drug resistance protein n=1 Tax=Kitasatospora setae (strain ATCC 33774 / DSM 43861 / JCM 3304 / KCC A-0304 / NBRC 14216 / KM-6054) TaxID=452652 RepID=E4ND67_KITSK|nr:MULTISPECIES: MFS transporter [Kitasatospora]BAJ29148.1 putative drug resistance protein [Kitasatospora setae KM-6054]